MSDEHDPLVRIEQLTGEIDIANVDELAARLTTLPNTVYGLIVDLSEVTYLDSAGTRLLHDLHDRLDMRDQHLVVVSPPQTAPRRILDLTAFHDRVTVADSLEAARALATAGFTR